MKRLLHRIATIHFWPGTNEGPIECSCQWIGLVSRWDIHRGAAIPDTCPQGHDDWTTQRQDGGRYIVRVCRTCKNARSAEQKRRARARAKEQREAVLV